MADEIGRLVLVRLSGKPAAIDLASVTEVTELPETWQIPLAPGFFKGVMNSHGSLIPVLDLASLSGSGVGRSDGKALILDRRLADLALWVDDVERVIPYSEAIPVSEADGEVPAVLKINGAEVPLLSAESLVQMLEIKLQEVSSASSDGSKGKA
jgi:chemotaxis signal transduction protein